jgi:hypothetical protein
MPTGDGRYRAAIERIDAANRQDPNRESWQGQSYPKELLYSERMSAWLERLESGASEALRLAVRAQHLCRWRLPRSDYPAGRRSYLAWRRDCARMHADLAAELLREVGYDDQTVGRTEELILKRRLELDPESQLLEDVACLVFLESYLAGFAPRLGEAKVVEILRKTWRKMSPRARREALALELPAELRELVAIAVGGAD